MSKSGSRTYRPGGEDVWERQQPCRELRRDGDALAAAQAVQYEGLLAETRVDRELCEAGFAAGFVGALPSGTLLQAELAESIRAQSEQAGVPWRGLDADELVEVLGETALGRRKELRSLLEGAGAAKDDALALEAVASGRTAALDSARDEAIADVRKVAAELHAALELRVAELEREACRVAEERNRSLADGRRRAEEERKHATAMLARGNDMEALDDLTLLASMYEHGKGLEATLEKATEALGGIRLEQALDEAAKTRETKEGNEEREAKHGGGLGGGGGGGGGGRATKITFARDTFMAQRIASWGTIQEGGAQNP